ncbi:hypothetical protein LTR84_012360 [Exophiala bonariae]|uniref:C2H2-type domain-containing protein n=1 Tax=Exophiala bonariae TaxID=1690606 RepID=A0AAV9NIE9_9EURO|nr:hypothetical protein LTR84_012360 [Exophiala bonariae]
MEVRSKSSNPPSPSITNESSDKIEQSPSRNGDDEFDAAQCLFCNQTSTDLDQNLTHMLKAHGLFVDSTNLLVDVGSLLAYFHFIISELYECLYCGTQRNTRQAVQQHMMAKGHCKYDISDEDGELREFYDIPVSDAREELQQKQLLSQTRPKKSRALKHSDGHGMASSIDQALRTGRSPLHSDTEPESSSNNQVSTRALKQEHTLNSQLTRLRADDRRSLLHLPASQQRALLITHHKQMEKARRTEQASQGHLQTAGNTVNCLSKLRLVRKPPHMGHVANLTH